MASTANRIIKNTGWLYAKMAVTMFVSLYTTRLVLGSLGASDFGIYNIVGGAIAMLGFLNSSMAGASQRFMSYTEGEGNREKLKSIFNISLVLHTAISLIAVVAFAAAGYFFFSGILNIPADRLHAAVVIYGSMVVSTAFTIMSVPYEAVMNAHENMRYFAFVGIFESALKLAVAFATVYAAADKLIVYGLLMAVIPFVTLTFMRIYCHRHYAECIIAPRRYFDRRLAREMTGFAGWNMLSSVTAIGTQYGLGIVLNHFFGTLLNAAQGIANQLCGMLLAFSNNMLKAINPVIAKSEGSGNREKMIDVTLLSCKYSYLIFAVFVIPTMVDTEYILKLWLNDVPLWAVLFLKLQLIRSLFDQLIISINTAINAQGTIGRVSIYRSIYYVAPIILTYIGFSYGYEAYWLYIFWISCWCIVGGIVALYFCHKQCSLSYKRYFHVVILPVTICTAVSYFSGKIITSFMSEGLLRLAIVAAITIMMLLCSYWFFGTDKREKGVLKSLYTTLINIKP